MLLLSCGGCGKIEAGECVSVILSVNSLITENSVGSPWSPEGTQSQWHTAFTYEVQKIPPTQAALLAHWPAY